MSAEPVARPVWFSAVLVKMMLEQGWSLPVQVRLLEENGELRLETRRVESFHCLRCFDG